MPKASRIHTAPAGAVTVAFDVRVRGRARGERDLLGLAGLLAADDVGAAGVLAGDVGPLDEDVHAAEPVPVGRLDARPLHPQRHVHLRARHGAHGRAPEAQAAVGDLLARDGADLDQVIAAVGLGVLDVAAAHLAAGVVADESEVSRVQVADEAVGSLDASSARRCRKCSPDPAEHGQTPGTCPCSRNTGPLKDSSTSNRSMPGLPYICTGSQSFSVPKTRKLTRPRLAGSNLSTDLAVHLLAEAGAGVP